MIDNFEKIKPLMEFNSEDDFYFLQIIQRKKDTKALNLELKGSNNSSRLIKAYYIYSVEQLEKQKEEIITLCNIFNARAGINLNKRNAKQMSLEMMALLATNIKNNHFVQLHKLYSTVCGQHHSQTDKLWIIDIDDKNFETRHKVIKLVRTLEPHNTKKFVAEIESKGGFHLITRPFNSQKFREVFPEIEIHKNNPTNLYIP